MVLVATCESCNWVSRHQTQNRLVADSWSTNHNDTNHAQMQPNRMEPMHPRHAALIADDLGKPVSELTETDVVDWAVRRILGREHE